MKYGVSQEQRSQFASDDEFKERFKSLCLEYENCRKEIDNYLESVVSQDLNSATNPSKASREDAIPREWREKEAKLESEINRFVGWLDLRQGDVVKVQRRVPHSLQYGITVVEFQTPVYERLIVTFNQKVLTQSHWDVSKAFEIMEINHPLSQNLLCLEDNDQILMEQVVDFKDFEVLRITQRAETFKLDLGKFGHSIIFALKSNITVIGDEVVALASGEACFIPAACSSILVKAESDDAIWLLGREKIV
jgi:mannose-6-phosphate isomerase class I